MSDLLLHGFWRSSAAYRVRIALNLKRLPHRLLAHDLRLDEHLTPAYGHVNPQHLVPVLEIDGTPLPQSPAILEWLEEVYPEPPLLPPGAWARAVVRAMSAVIACDVHPLNNLRVLKKLRSDFHAPEAAVSEWIATWMHAGFSSLETQIERHGGRFAFGDAVGMADVYLVPQVYSAERFGVDLEPYPRLKSVAAAARALPEFTHAEPGRQADAPSSVAPPASS